jgi:peptide-methionine (S)-S-oxide reductase
MKALLFALLLALPVAVGVARAADTGGKTDAPAGTLASAVFAGGCFWCMEHPFDELDGVVSTTSGYIGGHTPSPTYSQVSAGTTGHAEAVKVVYDPAKVGYGRLLEVFWRNVDPLDGGGQFCDRGDQYRTAIFYETEEQRQLAEGSKQELAASGRFDRPIVTPIVAAGEFFPAEDYHQNYYLVNPIRYKFYRHGCGRDKRLKEVWGDEAPKAAG